MYEKLNIAFKDNSLDEVYRLNLMMLGWVTVIFLFPFAIFSFFQGRNLAAALMLFVVCIALINSISLHYKKRKLIPYFFFFVVKLSTQLYAIFVLGYVTVFWSFPFAFIIFFVQPLKQARVMAIVMATTLIWSVFYKFEVDLASRYALTLMMLMLFCDVFVRILIIMESRLTELAIRDPLTNAYNRRYMNTCLETTIEETRRDFGPACLIVLDVDHFKKINDEHGHSAGDVALEKLVDHLNNSKRKLDYVFRIGGEEFALILRNTSLRQGIQFAEKLRASVEEAKLIEDQVITISLGVAEYKTGETDDEWLKRADENLYTAKYKGRNRVCPEEITLLDYQI